MGIGILEEFSIKQSLYLYMAIGILNDALLHKSFHIWDEASSRLSPKNSAQVFRTY